MVRKKICQLIINLYKDHDFLVNSGFLQGEDLAPKREKDLEETVQKAIRQIIDKKYAASLTGKGVTEEKIRIYGFAFKGKEVLIDGGYIGQFEGHVFTEHTAGARF